MKRYRALTSPTFLLSTQPDLPWACPVDRDPANSPGLPVPPAYYARVDFEEFDRLTAPLRDGQPRWQEGTASR